MNLKIALCHLNVRYKKSAINRRSIVRLTKRAAGAGANIVVHTEAAVSGYGFESLEDVEPYAETINGTTISLMSEMAKSLGIYLVLGWIEKDPATGIFYNAASAIDPKGEVVCHVRKINAESRWARPGPSAQDPTFDTRWGRIGILICSDSYFGLMPRTLALKDVDLLLVPANWPMSGIDPSQIWRVRAMENGFYLAACNRTGVDRVMECRSALSCAFDPHGKPLLSLSGKHSRVGMVDIPLKNGRIPSQNRRAALAPRQPAVYRPIYLDMRHAQNIGQWYDLPKPGQLSVTAFCHEEKGAPPYDVLFATNKKDGFVLWPESVSHSPHQIRQAASDTARKTQKAVAASYRKNDRKVLIFADKNGKLFQTKPLHGDQKPAGKIEDRIFDIPGARIALADPEDMIHPEMAVAYSKLGCDLVAVSGGKIGDKYHALLSARSVEQVFVAVAGWDRAFICRPPRGHERWREKAKTGTGKVSDIINTKRTREKKFPERMDYSTLLALSAPKENQ